MTPRRSILLLAAMLALAGCYEYKVKYDGWETFRSQVGDPPGGVSRNNPDDPTQPEQAPGYAILIESFEGNARHRRAADLVRRLTNRFSLGDLWTQEKDGKVAVYQGRYASVADIDGQQKLIQVRALEENGETPYANVDLVPIGGSRSRQPTGSNDLRAYVGQGFYTLQIGFYDEDYGPDFRDAAEAAARNLRQSVQTNDGHEVPGVRAFFFHGPTRSMVTVEMFTDADFEQDGAVRVYGPRITALQQREGFQYNLANGRTILETITDGKKSEKRAQQSFIVKVPDR